MTRLKIVIGSLQKMTSELQQPVQYQLPTGDQLLPINPLIGKTVEIHYTGQIFCIHCQSKTRKSYNQGYCYPCFIKLAQCDMCIMKPETCHYAAGTCREPEWGDKFCNQTHIVYLANSSGLKVGITRQTQIPTRWIDQGAVQALPILQATSRHISGLAETVLAQHVSDKTSWQQMLKQKPAALDLPSWRDLLLQQTAPELAEIRANHGADCLQPLALETVEICYPIESYPKKIKSLDLEKTPTISGVLQGIKGQYLLLDNGVINIRKYTGYEISFQAEP